MPCSIYTDPNNTVCVEEYKMENECPILDILVVKDDVIPRMKEHGWEVAETGYPQEDGYSTHFAFSRSTFRKGGN